MTERVRERVNTTLLLLIMLCLLILGQMTIQYFNRGQVDSIYAIVEQDRLEDKACMISNLTAMVEQLRSELNDEHSNSK